MSDELPEDVQPAAPKGAAVCPTCQSEVPVDLVEFITGEYGPEIYWCHHTGAPHQPAAQERRRLVTTQTALGVAIQSALEQGHQPNELIGNLSGGASDAIVTVEADEGDGGSLDDALHSDDTNVPPLPEVLSDREGEKLHSDLHSELADPAAARRRHQVMARADGEPIDPPAPEHPPPPEVPAALVAGHRKAEAHFWLRQVNQSDRIIELLEEILKEQQRSNTRLATLIERLT